jgi:hypothetical protein
MMAVVVLALLPSDAIADVRYTSPLCSGDCSQASPCSLETAVSSALDNDEIVVGPGTYVLAATLTPGVSLNIHGTPGLPRPRIVADTIVALTSDFRQTLSDLAFQSSNAPFAVQLKGADSVADRVEVIASTASGSAVALQAGNGAVIRDSLLRAAGTSAAEALYYEATAPSNVTLRNVTGVASGAGSIGLVVFALDAGAGAAIEAVNVVANANVDLRAGAAPSATSAIHLVNSNFNSGDTPFGRGTVGGTGNQVLPPQFASTAGEDFHQAPSSPTIDAGLTDAANGPLDLDGNPRVSNGRTDIGAYEVQAPSVTASSTVIDTTAAAAVIDPLRLNRKGIFSTVLRCPAVERRCDWSYALRSVRSVRVRGKRRPLALGSGKASALGGHRVTVRIKLSKANFRLIKKRKRLRVKLTVKTRDAAANVATSKRIETLKAPKRAAR